MTDTPRPCPVYCGTCHACLTWAARGIDVQEDTPRPDPLVALREALVELDALSSLPVYLPPKPADEDDQYVLRGAVLALIESTRREIRAALDSIEGVSREVPDWVTENRPGVLPWNRPAASPSREGAGLDDAIADWLAKPPRTFSTVVTPDVEYGYGVAMAEIRSILRDPSGEHPTPDPLPVELRAAARLASEEQRETAT